jgi:hypothetical protein
MGRLAIGPPGGPRPDRLRRRRDDVAGGAAGADVHGHPHGVTVGNRYTNGNAVGDRDTFGDVHPLGNGDAADGSLVHTESCPGAPAPGAFVDPPAALLVSCRTP